MAEGPPGPPGLELVLFATRREEVVRALAAGIGSFIVDWEWRDKEQRQRGADAEINRDTPEDLERLRELGSPRRYCRLNRFGPWTREETETAVRAGATHLLLPMAERPGEVESVMTWAGSRCRVGILVETATGLEAAPELARLPLDRVYVGLNDLAINRGSASLFDAVADGTVAGLRRTFAGHRFGFAGVTVVDGGHPIPCRLLLAEMARLECHFSFLRRSFKRDVAERDMRTEVRRIRELWRDLLARPAREEEADRRALLDALDRRGDGRRAEA